MTIKMIVDKENHAINGVVMVGDAADGANAPHITDGGNAHNSSLSQIGEDASKEDAASINSNVKRRMTKNPSQIKMHNKNVREDAILTTTASLLGCGITGHRGEIKCSKNSHNANLNAQTGASVKSQNKAQNHADHIVKNAQEGAIVAIVSRQEPARGSGHKGKGRCNNSSKKIHAQNGGHVKEEDVA